MAVFIHGNHDGLDGRNESYTICRIDVPRRRLASEIRGGFHPLLKLVTLDGEAVPQQLGARAEAPQAISCADCLALANARFASPEPAGIPAFPRPFDGTAEIVHRQDGDPETFVVCRLGVGRRAAVQENAWGWHPGYHRMRVAGETYLRGNPNHESPDNVDCPWVCRWRRASPHRH